MNSEHRQDFLKKVVLSLWGFATIVLVMALLLLVQHMAQQGQYPFALPTPTPAPTVEIDEPTASAFDGKEKREASLYFATEDGSGLTIETQWLSLGDDTVANCHVILDALIAGPQGDLSSLTIPSSSNVRAVYLMADGELVIDLSMETVLAVRKFPSVSSENLLLQSIAHTLTAREVLGSDATAINSVRVLIEGAPPEESFQDAHCDWDTPVAPDPSWLGMVGDAGGQDA